MKLPRDLYGDIYSIHNDWLSCIKDSVDTAINFEQSSYFMYRELKFIWENRDS